MTNGLVYLCCDDRRRAALRKPAATLNGIDFLEVVDSEAPSEAERQHVLRVHFVRSPAGLADPNTGIHADNVRIDGGERIRDVGVRTATFVADVLVVRVDTPGDFSTYTLRLVSGKDPFPGLDPLLSAVDFSFKVECDSDFDCRPRCDCAPEALEEPEIDYLAKDYESFRQLLLDRMSLLAPGWTERSPADVGVALVELLAYVGDHLSYEQDAVATEAYLMTARRRASVRRHATLLDYPMHDGRNARAWLHVHVEAVGPFDAVNGIALPEATQILTEVPGTPDAVVPGTPAHAAALEAEPEVFETMEPATLWPGHERLRFHLWGQRDCCLPAGSTRATLAGDLPHLEAGDVLVLEEVLGPQTGQPEDADPARRHAVRLTEVRRPLSDPLFSQPITEIAWGSEDALPFALCLSATTDAQHGARSIEDVSVARANVVLADHGRTVADELLGAPERAPALLAPRASSCERCEPRELLEAPPRFEPTLREGPLTQAARSSRTAVVEGRRRRLLFDPAGSAASAVATGLDHVLPLVRLEDGTGKVWLPQRDLLGSDAFAPEFVAESDDEGRARLRFGDGQYGERPAVGVELRARYRVGNGARGNVGADALRHLVTGGPDLARRIRRVRNPLPARGGVDPEPLERVRQNAPAAFRTLERAVTPEDYAALAERHPEVQRAQATVRWTGSWRTVFLTVDRAGARPVDETFEVSLRTHLERYRMAGHDVEIDGPSFAALEVELLVCVEPDYFRSDVAVALREVLGSGDRADGTRGAFHPDNFTFGQPVYLSPLLAAAQAVPGVVWAEFLTFQRLGVAGGAALDENVLRVGRLEIARLDNDPSFPERGVLRLVLKGGR